jgi:hypothetical protein
MHLYLNSYEDFKALVVGFNPTAKVFYWTVGQAYAVFAFLTTGPTILDFGNYGETIPDLAADFPTGTVAQGLGVSGEMISTATLGTFSAVAGALGATEAMFFVDTDTSVQAYALVPGSEYVITLSLAASQNPPTAAQFLAALPDAVQLTAPVTPDPA